MKTVLVIAAAAANCALAVTLRGTGSGRNANDLVAWGSGSDSEQLEADGSLRPEVVAQLLGQVGMSWVHDRYEAMEHTISDTLALAHITESCSKVASAVVSASKGDRHQVKEYMGFVCEKSHHKPLCQNFTTDIYAFMNGDLMYNRQELNYTSFCAHLYNSTLVGAAKDEKARLETAWEEHLKSETAKAEAEKKAADAKAEADKKAAEEEKLAEERKLQADEASREAEEKEKAEQEKLAAQKALEEAEAVKAAKADAEEKAAAAQLADKAQADSLVKDVAVVASNSTQNATSTNATDVVLAKAPATTANATAAANATSANATNATAVANATNATKVA